MGKRIYNTKQRDDIMNCIDGFGDRHFTAAELVAKLNGDGIAVGQATVYRLIDRLEENGEVRKFIVDGTSAACYQRVSTPDGVHCHEHFHLKCEVCGRLIHTQCDELQRISEHVLSEHGFCIDNSKTVFYGICGKCRNIHKTIVE